MVNDEVPMRWAVPADAERIANYHHECWLLAFTPLLSPDVVALAAPRIERWKNWLEPDNDYVTVVAVDDDDRPIGHATVNGNHLAHLFVDPAFHRQGLGRELLKVGERLIRQRGHRSAELQTRVGNLPAIALYESNGWLLTEETAYDHDLPDGSSYPEHVLRKNLDAPGHVEANRDSWDDDASNWVDRGRSSWAAAPHWGEMAVPESSVNALPDLADRDVVELGCGTGYVRRGVSKPVHRARSVSTTHSLSFDRRRCCNLSST